MSASNGTFHRIFTGKAGGDEGYHDRFNRIFTDQAVNLTLFGSFCTVIATEKLEFMEFINNYEDSHLPITTPVPLSPPATPVLSPSLSDAFAHAQFYCAQGIAPSTKLAYQSDVKQFTAWCHREGLPSFPTTSDTVVLYLSAMAMAGKKVATLTRRVAAIKYAHAEAGYPSPTEADAVHAVLAGIRRIHGVAPQGVAALLPADIRRMVDALPDTRVGIRDRAILLVGFAGAFRRSEIVGLDVEDVSWQPDGVAVLLRRTKTDTLGKGRWVGIPYGAYAATCPVRALEAWLTASGITTGAIFRGMNKHGHLISERLSGRAVATLIKRAAHGIGIDANRVSGHTLRVSHVTVAARAGVPERVIQLTTGHKSVEMVRRYCRQGTLFSENSAAALGL